MAKFEAAPKIELEIILRLTETEARFLAGIAGYDHKTVEEVLSKNLGQAYTRDHIGGLYTFLKSVNEQIPAMLQRMDMARAVFQGTKVAVDPSGAK